MKTQVDVNEKIFWVDLPWAEVYRCDEKELGILPSCDRQYANPNLYHDTDRLKKTAEIVLAETKESLKALEQKILDYQPIERANMKRTGKALLNGEFKGYIHPVDFDRIPEQLAEVGEAFVKAGESKTKIVAVKAEDGMKYTGLVMVAKGLTAMLTDKPFVPEVIGKHFHDTYQNLLQTN